MIARAKTKNFDRKVLQSSRAPVVKGALNIEKTNIAFKIKIRDNNKKIHFSNNMILVFTCWALKDTCQI